MTPPTPTPPPPHDGAAALAFVRKASIALCDTGVPITHITERMQAIAAAYGLPDTTVFALPTGVFVRAPDGRVDVQRAFGISVGGAPFRLDQLTDLQELLDDATAGRIGAAAALDRLTAIENSPARYRPAVVVLGYALFGTGFGLLLQPPAAALLLFAVLSAIVGVAGRILGSHPRLGVIYPTLAAFAVTSIACLCAPRLGLTPTRALIPPLASMLPMAAVTYAVIDLSTGDAIAGAARLANSAQRLVLLAFGGYAAITLVHVDTVTPRHTLTWGPWLGVAVFCLGMALTQSALPGSVPYLFAVAYATFAVQFGAAHLGGPVLGAFAAGVASVVTAGALYRLPHAPPFYAAFVPVLWLIVPGAAGLQGAIDLQTQGSRDAVHEAGLAAMLIIALSIGILVATIIRPRLVGRRESASPRK